MFSQCELIRISYSLIFEFLRYANLKAQSPKKKLSLVKSSIKRDKVVEICKFLPPETREKVELALQNNWKIKIKYKQKDYAVTSSITAFERDE
jgi:hypothetical protein